MKKGKTEMTGYAVCGSFCTHERSLSVLSALVECGEDVVPILSERVQTTDTRFGKAADLIARVEAICGRKAIRTVAEAEPLGPATPLEALVICPCTGNTLAKLACGVSDGAVTLAAKAHMRQSRPLLIALASNDAMSSNLANLATLLMRKNVYFVPMRQDAPKEKPHSLVADFSLVAPALRALREGKQLRPLFLE